MCHICDMCMGGETQSDDHFLRRRQVLKGAGAAMLALGMNRFAAAAEKPTLVGGLPVT